MKEIQSDIGFSDGEIQCYEKEGDNIVVHLTTWNDAKMKIFFRDTIGVSEFSATDISGFFEYEGRSALLKKALAYVFDEIPEKCPYQHYFFLNTDNQPCLEIVAAEMEIHIETG